MTAVAIDDRVVLFVPFTRPAIDEVRGDVQSVLDLGKTTLNIVVWPGPVFARTPMAPSPSLLMIHYSSR
jgi:hypothetical protein